MRKLFLWEVIWDTVQAYVGELVSPEHEGCLWSPAVLGGWRKKSVILRCKQQDFDLPLSSSVCQLHIALDSPQLAGPPIFSIISHRAVY